MPFEQEFMCSECGELKFNGKLSYCFTCGNRECIGRIVHEETPGRCYVPICGATMGNWSTNKTPIFTINRWTTSVVTKLTTCPSCLMLLIQRITPEVVDWRPTVTVPEDYYAL